MTLAEQIERIADTVGETYPFQAARLRVIAGQVGEKEQILDDIIADLLRDARDGRLDGYVVAVPPSAEVLAFPGGTG